MHMSALAARPPLNDRQKAFAAEYLRTKDAIKSYLKIYPGSTLEGAQSSAYRLRDDVRVQEIIQSAGEQLLDGAVLSLAEMQSYLSKVVKTPGGQVHRDHILCNGVKHTEHGVDVKMPDKLAAITLAAKLSGLLKEQPAVVIQTSVDTLLSGLMGTGGQVIDMEPDAPPAIQDTLDEGEECI
jgi:hypothetical protein